MVHYMLYAAHPAYCVTDFATASRRPVQLPNLPSPKKSQSRSEAKEKQQTVQNRRLRTPQDRRVQVAPEPP